MNIKNITLDENKYGNEFNFRVKLEINNLLAEIKEEYKEDAERLALEIVKTYKEISRLEPGEEQDALKENMNHLQAAMTHFESIIEIKLYKKVVKICEIAADIAIKIAIASILAL